LKITNFTKAKFGYNVIIYLLIKGKESPDAGIISNITSWKTANDNKTVTCKLIFSPESGGSKNP
jgi:hypothetical protein